MTLNEVYSNLCRHDRRSIEFKDQLEYMSIEEAEEDAEEPRTDCSCDNCFYGRDELALVILELVVKGAR